MDDADSANLKKAPPRLLESFKFPVATAEARRDLFMGGIRLFTLVFGWIVNLGHRLEVVRRLALHDPPFFRGFRPFGRLFSRGCAAALAILAYLAPAAAAAACAPEPVSLPSLIASALFFLAIFALPAGMTLYAARGDASLLVRPDRALARAVRGGRAYFSAWGIGGLAVALSFLGSAALGVGFFFTSVWAWQVVGYAFARALVIPSPIDPERA